MIRVALVVNVALVAGCAITAEGLPCSGDRNCPDGFACHDGACTAALAGADAGDGSEGAGEGGEGDAGEGELDGGEGEQVAGEGEGDVVTGEGEGELVAGEGEGEGEGEVSAGEGEGESARAFDARPIGAVALQQGSTPRVVVHDGVVDVWFVASSCQGVQRARPATNAVTSIVGSNNGCFIELDAIRGPQGLTGVAMRRRFDDGSSGLLMSAFDDDGNQAQQSLTANPGDASDHRGRMPRLAINGSASLVATWSSSWQGTNEVESLSPASGSGPVRNDVLYGSADGLATAFDTAGNHAVFVVDVSTNENQLFLEYLDTERLLERSVTGAIDAVQCGGALHVAYRKGSDLEVDTVDGQAATAELVAGGLPLGRSPGDIALACDQGALYLAHARDDGSLVLFSRAGGAWSAPEVVADAHGAVSLSVVGGTPHLAYAVAGGGVWYATR